MKKVLFIDRDGTIITEPPDDYQVDSYEKLRFEPGVITALGRIIRELDYELVMVTNQDGLGTDLFPQDAFDKPHNLMMSILEGEGIRWKSIHIDKSLPQDKAPTRKPGTALLTRYLEDDYDQSSSFVIGDRASDMLLAKNLGAKAIRYGQPLDPEDEAKFEKEDLSNTVVLETNSWDHIYRYLRSLPRRVVVHRKTNETDVNVVLNLDGSGVADIDTGISFFDHMLDQLARHGGLDLTIKVDGDLEVDEHHTIEDTALALGEAFRNATTNKLGMNRYGFTLPMDESLATIAIDFGGRPWLIWNCEFSREYLGDMPTEMFHHFFKSFTDTARVNLNIEVNGKNEHHKIEAIFKAFAKAIKMAVSRDTDSRILPTTKGVL